MLALLIFLGVAVAIVGVLLIFCEFEDWLDKVLGTPESEIDE